MNRIKEIFGRVAHAIPGGHKPATLQEAQESIAKDTSYAGTLKRWANNVGALALGMLGIAVFAKMGMILAPAAVVAAGFVALRAGVSLINRDIKSAKRAEAAFIEAANAPKEAPTPAPVSKADLAAAAAFKAKAEAANQNAARIKELEQQLAGLELAAEQKRKAKELGL